MQSVRSQMNRERVVNSCVISNNCLANTHLKLRERISTQFETDTRLHLGHYLKGWLSTVQVQGELPECTNAIEKSSTRGYISRPRPSSPEEGLTG